jgi:serine O-acetyltransferase
VTELESPGGTLELLKEDWVAHRQRPWLKAGFYAVAAHRLGRAVEEMPAIIRRPVRAVALLVSSSSGIELPRGAQLGRRVRFAHQPGVVIADNVVIGDDCLIRQNVTIGSAVEYGPAPRLGNRVRVGAGAVLIGDISIGDDVVIGPNAVVTTDVPARSTVLAAPSRVLRASDLSSPPLDGDRPRHSGKHAVTVQEVISAIAGSFERIGTIDARTSILSSGLIDSLDIPVLLELIESRFDVVVPVEQVTAEDLDTPEQIAAVINGA